MRGQRPSQPRPGNTDQTAGAAVYVRDPKHAADDPGDQGKQCLPMVSRTWAARSGAPFQHLRKELHAALSGYRPVRENLSMVNHSLSRLMVSLSKHSLADSSDIGLPKSIPVFEPLISITILYSLSLYDQNTY